MRLTVYLALFISLTVPAAVHAEDIITISGLGQTLTFDTPANPTPVSTFPDTNFVIANVPVTFNGAATTDTFAFYTNDAGGGFADNFFGDPLSAQLFSGDVTAPIFLPGVYDFYDSNTGDLDGTVTITSTPEPDSLVLLGTGVLGLAGAIRRRR